MKKTISIILSVIIIITGVVIATIKIPPKVVSLSEKGLPTEGVNLIAHRGFSAVAPENSSAAFIKAGEAKFFAAECDIQLTKDEIWVLNHDDDIKRMTNGKGLVSEFTLGEIKEYKIDGGYNSHKYPDQELITLDSYLNICDEYDIIPQIEIKKGNNKCLDKILNALDNYEGMREKAMIISFDEDILKSIRETDSEIELWYLTHEITDDAIALCVDNNFALAFNGNKYIKSPNGGVEKAQQSKVKLACWTIDKSSTYKELYDLGIRNFTTNRLVK